jgi:[acyl-carrier-protein] S-malonyltransferase
MAIATLRDLDPARIALAFRGYNITNLGRTRALFHDERYGGYLVRELQYASEMATKYLEQPVDLVSAAREGIDLAETRYGEAVAFILAVEFAHFAILREIHGLATEKCRVAFGYSLGEIGALVCGGLLPKESAYEIPLRVANDCHALMADSRLAIVFSKKSTIPSLAIGQLCLDITRETGETIAVSSQLAPNTLLVIGQGESLRELAKRLKEMRREGMVMRLKDNRFPPLHTPIMWQRHLTDQASLMLQKVAFADQPPAPPVFSMATGRVDYTPYNAREHLRQWMDHPQRLWDAIDFTLSHGVDTVIHIGPDPNLIPATYKRLQENVTGQLQTNMGLLALSYAVHRPWLQSMLPQQAFLLRAPTISQVILEEELLADGKVNG